MPYNSETETFYQAPATVVDSTPDGDTVQEGFDDRLTPALTALYDDLNLLKADGMISVGIPATTTARGIGRVATRADLVDGATINNSPAFLAAGAHTSVAAAAGKVPVADSGGKLDSWVSQQTQYVTCTTAAATPAKDVSLTGFTLVRGARVFVTFTNTNTVAGALTLNVNGTGAKSIYSELGAVSATNPATFPAGVPIEFVYDDNGHWAYRKYQDEFAKTVGGAPMFAVRAWWNFNSAGTLLSGGNVSGVTKNSTGIFTVTLATAMANANFAISNSYQLVTPGASTAYVNVSAKTTTSVQLQFVREASLVDPSIASGMIVG